MWGIMCKVKGSMAGVDERSDGGIGEETENEQQLNQSIDRGDIT